MSLGLVGCYLLTSNLTPVIPLRIILFVSADSANKLNEQAEFEAVENVISSSAQHGTWKVVQIKSCTFQRFQSGIHHYQPTILHFSGHGGKSGLCFQDQKLRWGVLTTILKTAHKSRLCSVILSSCYFESGASRVADAVGFAVAMQGTVMQNASIAFSEIFYRALGDGKTFEKSFQSAAALGSGLSTFGVAVVPRMWIASWL